MWQAAQWREELPPWALSAAKLGAATEEEAKTESEKAEIRRRRKIAGNDTKIGGSLGPLSQPAATMNNPVITGFAAQLSIG